MSADNASRLVQRGALLYVHALPTDTEGDVAAQTRRALADVDRLLAQAGSSKAKVLTAQVRLRDLAEADAHDAAWREWVDPARPPVLARSQADLGGAHRVELEITATR